MLELTDAKGLLNDNRAGLPGPYRNVPHKACSPTTLPSRLYGPHACAAPAPEAIVAGWAGAMALWQITSRRSRPQEPEDTDQDTPFLNTKDIARFAGKDRVNQPPFDVAEGVSHGQGSFSELESCRHAKTQCLFASRHADGICKAGRPLRALFSIVPRRSECPLWKPSLILVTSHISINLYD